MATAAKTRLLTIGTVCGMLKDEFQDISISKIRYLEDQGLLAPRRTQGGYVARQQSHAGENDDHSAERHRIVRRHAKQEPRQEPCHEQRHHRSDRDPEERQCEPLTEHHPEHVP